MYSYHEKVGPTLLKIVESFNLSIQITVTQQIAHYLYIGDSARFHESATDATATLSPKTRTA